MHVLGLGIDIVEIRRIKEIMAKNNTFIDRIFTSREKKYCTSSKKIICLANRYAAKEAFVKALGTGFRKGINFKNIEIKKNKLGKPFISVNKVLNKRIKKKFNVKKFNIFLSLSDEKKYSIANIIITD